MRFSNEYGDRTKDPGVWRLHHKTPDGTRFEFRICRIPSAVDTRIRKMHGDSSLHFKKREGRLPLDTERDRAITADLAVEGLRDCRVIKANDEPDTLDHNVADDAAAAKWSEILGRAVKAGEDVDLCGKLGCDAIGTNVKKHWLPEQLALCDWIVVEANKLAGAEADEEAGLAKN